MGETPPPAHSALETTESSGGAAVASLAARIAVGLAGLGLLVGFFLPWVRLGDVVSLSGLGMALTGGEAIKELSGPFRSILFVVPLAGLALIASAIRDWAVGWAGLAGGLLIVAIGLFTLIRVFLDSTGAGMWVVALSALVATAVGVIAYRNR
jgi:hypothetical protein